jgi:hypothetical protein
MLAGTLMLGFSFKAEMCITPADVRLLLSPGMPVRISCLRYAYRHGAAVNLAFNFFYEPEYLLHKWSL